MLYLLPISLDYVIRQLFFNRIFLTFLQNPACSSNSNLGHFSVMGPSHDAHFLGPERDVLAKNSMSKKKNHPVVQARSRQCV